MRALFLDTAGWFAALSPREAHHATAKAVYADAARDGVRLITTSLVLAEMHALTLRWSTAAAGRRLLDLVLDSNTHTLIEVDRDVLLAARDRWIRKYPDAGFSLCDAVSFDVMRRERIKHVLTLDRHFTQAGFEILPA